MIRVVLDTLGGQKNRVLSEYTRYNSDKYLRENLKSIKALSRYLQNKRNYSSKNSLNQWTEYVIFGKYLLDSSCQMWTIFEAKGGVPENCQEVMRREQFLDVCEEYSLHAGMCLPSYNEKCPTCGRRFNIKDIRTGNCVRNNGKIYHKGCL